MGRRRVSYFYDRDVGAYTYGYGHLMKPHRIQMTHELVVAYDLLDKMTVMRPPRATAEQMTAFHSDEYINFLSRVQPDTPSITNPQLVQFLGFPDDNPPFDGVFEYHTISSGGSLAAAEAITSGASDIAINWAGGLHHAKKSEASGFCFINDINLCILELLRFHTRVLYVDIDCHHGDGVEEAFLNTDRVMTCSFHKSGNFFPGTGTTNDTGKGKGRGYSVNVPLHDGLSDESFKHIFEPVCAKIIEVFRPSVVVLQCGADSLSGDRLGCFNLSMQGHANCVQYFRDSHIPLILLGGGGYTIKNVARTWSYETACAVGMEETMGQELPWHDHFECYGPRFRLEVAKSNAEDENLIDGYLEVVKRITLERLSKLPHAPSVGMHEVPSQSVAEHIGFVFPEEDDKDDVDRKLFEHARDVVNLVPSSGSEDEMDIDVEDDEIRYRAASVASSRRKMSIMTNQWTDVNGSMGSRVASSKRRFFRQF